MNAHRSLKTAALTLGLLSAASLSACRERGKGEQLPESVASVNGAPITLEAFSRELAFVQRTNSGVLPQVEAEQLAFRRAVLEDMIDRMLVLGAAHEASVTLPAEKVDRELLKLKAEYHGASFNEALAEGQLSQQELRERTRARLLTERYFVDTVFARIAVLDADLEAYYKEHAAEFAQPEEVRAAQIVVQTQDEARKVQAQLRNGMGFDEAARRYSLSPDAKVGGDLGYFARGVMPEAFDRACFELPEGKVSEIVESAFGFHLFKVLDKRPAEQRPFEKVRSLVERRVLRHKQEQAQREVLQALRAKANIHIDEEALAKVRF